MAELDAARERNRALARAEGLLASEVDTRAREIEMLEVSGEASRRVL